MEKLRQYLNSLTQDQQEEFARKCGTTIGYMRKAISVGTNFRPQVAVNIERESMREVTIEDLLPEVDWEFIRASV